MRIGFFGDSLTEGLPGVPCVDILQERFPNDDLVNFGRAGDSVVGTCQRVRSLRGALRGDYDVALIFSQGQDVSEIADEIRVIAAQQNWWMRMASAFPATPTLRNRREIEKTAWIKIARGEYDHCIDPGDYC